MKKEKNWKKNTLKDNITNENFPNENFLNESTLKEESTKKKKGKEKKPFDKARHKKIRRRIIFGSIAVFLIAVFALSTLAQNGRPIVLAETATRGDVEQLVNTSGQVLTEKTMVYFANVSLPVSSIKVEPGDAVTSGQVLMTYDETALDTEIKLNELQLQSIAGGYENTLQSNYETVSDLNEANTNLPVLDQQIADTEAYINNLNQKIETKQAELAFFGTQLQITLQEWSDKPNSEEYENLLALIEYNRYEQQYNEEILSWQDELVVYNDMLAEYQEYRAEMKSQQSSSEAGRITSASKSELDANKESQDIQTNQTLAELEAARSGITAEFAGVVTSVDVTEGTTTTPGSQLITLVSSEDVMVKIYVSKYDLEKLKEGQEADITVAGSLYQGKISKISKIAENNQSGTPVVAAEIKITNPDDKIYLGVEARVEIHTAKADSVVLVPVEAVNVDHEGEFVYITENDIIVKQPVVTGISSTDFIEIKEGLQEGDSFISNLPTGISEGMAVDITFN